MQDKSEQNPVCQNPRCRYLFTNLVSSVETKGNIYDIYRCPKCEAVIKVIRKKRKLI